MHNQQIKNNLYLQIRKSSFYMLAGKLITPIINFLITIYIVRMLSVNDYGIYNVLLAIMAYISLFSSLGLPSVFQRYIPKFHEDGEMGNLKILVTRGSLGRIVLSALFVFLVILLSNQLGKLFRIYNWFNYFKIFSLGIIFALEAELLGIALTSLFLHKHFVISSIIYTCVRALILYFLLKVGLNLTGLLLGEVLAYAILVTIFTYFYYSKFSKLKTVRSKNEFPIKRLLKYGGYSYFNEVGATILDITTDFFVISAFLGPVAVGIYAFSNRVVQLLSRWMPHKLFQEVIRPAFFTRYAQKADVSELGKMFNLLTKFTAFFLFPLATGIFVLGDKLIMYVFDPKYLSSLKILWIVAAFSALNSFMFPIGLVLQSIEKVQILFYSKIFAIYNLIADLLVIKSYGIMGIAFATGTAVLFKNLFCYLSAKRYTDLVIDLRGLLIIFINSIVMGFLLLLVRVIVVDVLFLIMATLIGIGIYLIFAYFNKSFSREERDTINKILPKPIFVF